MKAVISAALERLQETLEDGWPKDEELRNGMLALDTLKVAIMAGCTIEREVLPESEPTGDPDVTTIRSDVEIHVPEDDAKMLKEMARKLSEAANLRRVVR